MNDMLPAVGDEEGLGNSDPMMDQQVPKASGHGRKEHTVHP